MRVFIDKIKTIYAALVHHSSASLKRQKTELLLWLLSVMLTVCELSNHANHASYSQMKCYEAIY